MTDDYKRITLQFKELQNKFKHFEKADKERFVLYQSNLLSLYRYLEIKKMNESELHELKEKIVRCDKTIHIQQLGMQWNPPAVLEQIVTADNSRGFQSYFIKLKFLVDDQNSISGSLKKETIKGEEFQFTIPQLDMEIITDILLIETDFLLDEKVV